MTEEYVGHCVTCEKVESLDENDQCWGCWIDRMLDNSRGWADIATDEAIEAAIERRRNK